MAKANPDFEKRRREMHSAPFATAKDSNFRAIIERIISQAQAKKSQQQVLQHLEAAYVAGIINEKLLKLPELSDSDEAIDAWTDLIVYPQLRRKQRVLRTLFDEGKLRKARDQNGKFQVSRLKPLVRETVARIAKVPRVYYFHVG